MHNMKIIEVMGEYRLKIVYILVGHIFQKDFQPTAELFEEYPNCDFHLITAAMFPIKSSP